MSAGIIIFFGITYLCILVFSFYFSGNEAGFISLNKEKFSHDVELGEKKALRIRRLVEHPDQMLGTTLFGNNIANISAAYIVTYLCVQTMDEKMAYLFNIGTTILLLIFGEILPKIIFKNFTEALLYRIGHFLNYFTVIFYPFVWTLTRLSDFFIFPFIKKKSERYFSKKDFSSLLIDSYEEGLFQGTEKYFVETVSSLSRIKVVEVMKPLVDLFLVSKNEDVSSVINDIRMQNEDYIPVYEGRIDNLIGYVDLLNVFYSPKKKKIARDFLIETEYIPEAGPLDKAFSLFSKNDKRVLVAVDEYGGCSGIVKQKDVIDRIFGFTYNNTEKESSKLFKEINKNTYEIDTLFDIDDFNKRLNLKIPKKGYETLGGFIHHLFETIPSRGESIKWENLKFTIKKARKTGVDMVIMEILKRK